MGLSERLKAEMEKPFAQQILQGRRHLGPDFPAHPFRDAEEGGCGVTGFACNIPVSGRHIFEPSVQMHNRGNGKGGGIAAVGLDAKQLGVDERILEEDFLLQVAFLDEAILPALEEKYIRPHLQVHHEAFLETIDDWRDLPGLDMKPPAVKRYFVRVKPDSLRHFQKERGLSNLPGNKAEEEFIYQNSFRLNQNYYSSLGDKSAFVLSHGRNMMILKIVGYAEQVAQYYQLENFKAHVWIAHQRYPTKGRVWHPGGAHPFIGLDEALVHNGDFANYYSVTEYLKQRNVYAQFLTDTEVSVLVFDLLNRVYGYPLEYIIEALAPTAEMDFDHLPEEKQRIYRQIQATQIHGSPDGPWFFIIARTLAGQKKYQLIGITDTAMLRPQVFALQKGDFEIGLICSEKQAIDATLQSLAKENPRFGTVADRYWNARGGSYTDGGAFIFTVAPNGTGEWKLTCTDKFGREIDVPSGRKPYDFAQEDIVVGLQGELGKNLDAKVASGKAGELFACLKEGFASWDYETIRSTLDRLVSLARDSGKKGTIIDGLTLAIDRHYPIADKRRRSLLQMVADGLDRVFKDVPLINGRAEAGYVRIDWENRGSLRAPKAGEEILVMDVSAFPPEGDDCHARLVVDAYHLGWKRFICTGHKGQRFLGCALGPDTRGVRIDAYGSTGDYLGSGLDGLEIQVHGNGQDQLGQILKSGKLVIHGDVGQTFMYGAKGGEVYVLGNAAGRPLINAVGKPRVVINGTALDFLAESFMAGDPYNGGGFVILNGITFDADGRWASQETPYPGSNLFSLASGGAIFVRDPHRQLVPEQLNGGQFSPFGQREWELILPYLRENERLFGISIENDLLTVEGVKREPEEVYRTISAVKLSVLTGEGAAIHEEWERD
ncbi:MAG: glutamate synthase alpha subunit domain protein [Deltaproteobacteria bacterium]|nr:glutamate synthase alpha subunit domain protein [Deltaproteobacteria bacterium]